MPLDGLSPRLRGNRLQATRSRGPWREPLRTRGPPAGLSPRLRGNHPLRIEARPVSLSPRLRGTGISRSLWGLSPRLRGNPGHWTCNYRACYPQSGSIPAPAGEPLRYRDTTRPTTAGLSPRLRGNRYRPRIKARRGLPTGVYPRACGGTLDISRWTHERPLRCGSIPAPAGEPIRMRRRVMLTAAGSIPAPAGEPRTCRLGLARTAHSTARAVHPVYPRACGGTKSYGQPVVVSPRSFGLSPRLRGNPGGQNGRTRPMGLSPRLRGNRFALTCNDRRAGSIPAPAGEPPRPDVRVRYGKVYPRACGGTVMLSEGLSPRLRGNHGITPPRLRAGQLAGLSPRLRGNRFRRDLRVRITGSIPAPAGEPAGHYFRHDTPGRPRSIPAPAGEPF